MAVEPIYLTPADQKALEGLAEDIAALDREIARAEEAGLDVTELKEKHDKAKKLREGILRVYGVPGR